MSSLLRFSSSFSSNTLNPQALVAPTAPTLEVYQVYLGPLGPQDPMDLKDPRDLQDHQGRQDLQGPQGHQELMMAVIVSRLFPHPHHLQVDTLALTCLQDRAQVRVPCHSSSSGHRHHLHHQASFLLSSTGSSFLPVSFVKETVTVLSSIID